MTTASSASVPVSGGTLMRAYKAAAPAALGAAVAAVVVAEVGKALGAAHVQQLMAGPLVFLTILGVLIATIVWTVISRRAAQPERLLSRLVPVVLVLSLVPDVALGVNGTAWGAVVTLMFAHLSVFAVAVPLLAKLLPPASLARTRAG